MGKDKGLNLPHLINQQSTINQSISQPTNQHSLKLTFLGMRQLATEIFFPVTRCKNEIAKKCK